MSNFPASYGGGATQSPQDRPMTSIQSINSQLQNGLDHLGDLVSRLREINIRANGRGNGIEPPANGAVSGGKLAEVVNGDLAALTQKMETLRILLDNAAGAVNNLEAIV